MNAIMKEGMRQTSRGLIFLHAPRTAGSTAHMILESQYPSETVCTVELLSEAQVNDFRSLPLERREQIRVLKGHMGFGAHALLPVPCDYFTLLREPLERVISYYYYLRRRPEDGLHEAATEMSLSDFVRSGIGGKFTDNGMTRLLAANVVVEDRPLLEADFERARFNLLERVKIVGLSDRFLETMVLLSLSCGWTRPVIYQNANVTAGRPHVSDIADEDLGLLRQRNAYDLALYELARGKLERAIRNSGIGFGYYLKRARTRVWAHQLRARMRKRSRR